MERKFLENMRTQQHMKLHRILSKAFCGYNLTYVYVV